MLNKKNGVGPVIVVSLLLFVTIVSFVSLQNWYESSSSNIITNFESDLSVLDSGTYIQEIKGSTLYLRSTNRNLTVHYAKVGDSQCEINRNVGIGFWSINISECLDGLVEPISEFVLITDKGVLSRMYTSAFCSLGGVAVPHFGTHNFSNSLIVPYGGECHFEERQCINGELSGNPQFNQGSCRVLIFDSTLYFMSPTPVNFATLNSRHFSVNVSIPMPNLSGVIYNFNGSNYSLYDDSLVLMMNFDNRASLGENNTFVRDLSLYENHGDIVGGAQIVDGYHGSGIESFANGEGVDLGLGYDFGGRDHFSISLWIKQNDPSFSSLVSKYDRDSSSNREMSLYTYSSGQLVFLRECSPYNFVTGYFIPNDEWIHILVTYDGNEQTVYINGEYYGSRSHTCSVTRRPNALTTIGTFQNASGYSDSFDGIIDEVRIWYRALSEEEARVQYMSNLYRYNENQWYLEVNQSGPFNLLLDGTYNYQVFAEDSGTNFAQTERRDVTLTSIVSFAYPTPLNFATLNTQSFLVNTSIRMSELESVTYNWNGSNFTLYDDSLVFMMNFDNRASLGESATFMRDMSRYNNHGACSGSFCPTWISDGRYGGAFEFNGVNNVIRIQNTPSIDITGDQFTLAAWVYPTNVDAGDRGIISKAHEGSSNRERYHLGFNAGGNLNVRIDNGTDNQRLDAGGGSLVNDEWQFIVARYDGNTLKAYINGVEVGSGTASGFVAPSSQDLLIGKRYDTRHFEGRIDEPRIWNRALSEEEIMHIYNSNLYRYNFSQWYLEVEQVNFIDDIFSYQVFARDNNNNTESTENRQITLCATCIHFIYPTPINFASLNAISFLANVSIPRTNFESVTYNWNGSNFTLYDDSLVLMVNFDNRTALGDSSTSFKDFSIYGNDAGCSSSTCPTLTSDGRFGGAIYLNGVDERATIPNSASLQTIGQGGFTISYWVKSTQDCSGNKVHIGRDQGGGFSQFIWMGCGSSGRAAVTVGDSNGIYGGQLESITRINDGQWYHITGVREGNQTRIYINGEFEGLRDTSFTGTFASTRTWKIGYYLSSYYFEGYLDEFRIYNRTLSDDEIRQLYRTNLYKFDENQWYLDVEQKYIPDGTYDYQVFVQENVSSIDSTDLREITICSSCLNIISFAYPTPSNFAIINSTNIPINLSISSPLLKSVTYNWNGSNFTFYDDSLVLMMNFDNRESLGENSTFVRDLSMYRNNGQIIGSNVEHVSNSRFGGAFQFDGDNDSIIRVPRSSLFNFDNSGDGFSVFIWFKKDNICDSEGIYRNEVFIHRYGTGATTNTWWLGCNHDSEKMQFSIYPSGSSSVTIRSPNPINDGNWNHAGWVYDPVEDEVRLYLNGVQVNSSSITLVNPFSSTNSLCIAGWGSNCLDYEYTGMLDEPRVWNRALTNDEIYKLYNSNLYKYNETQWYYEVNQNVFENGTYTFKAFMSDKVGNVPSTTGEREVDVCLSCICDDLPGEWVLVPGNSLYGTTDFCVMKYEAKAYNTTSSSFISDGGNSLSSNWADLNEIEARSVPEYGPWVFINQIDSREACDNLNNGVGTYQLITNTQWMTIARNIEQEDENWVDSNGDITSVGVGSLKQGNVGSSGIAGASYNGPDPDYVGAGSGSNRSTNSPAILTLSNGEEIWDLSGNVFNWVNDTVSMHSWISEGVRNYWNFQTSSSYRLNAGPSNSSWGSSTGVGYVWHSGSSNGIVRGGAWGNGDQSGLFAINYDLSSTGSLSYVGFRCTYIP